MGAEQSRSDDSFSFTDRERLYTRIDTTRLLEILGSDLTTAHDISLSSNDYGEFLFVTLSQPAGNDREYLTFWGLGFHEQREQWITDEWQWYDSYVSRHKNLPTVEKTDAQAQVTARIAEVASNAQPQLRSKRAQLFELLADLTDEDGATTELEDLGIWDDGDLE